MRTRTRNAILAILAILVALLALGALPGLLKSGDPYYLTVEPQGPWNATDERLDGTNQTAINASELSEQRYPFTSTALDNAGPNSSGQSDPYWRGPTGLKELFTHSVFDEREALSRQNASAVAEEGIYVHDGQTVYLLTITQTEQ
ncbi:MAG: hypothetical protein V5A45_05095 [Haloarculaceae archaeon]